MPVPDRSNVGFDTELYEQYVLNRTFDPEFNVMAVEMLGYDPSANVLRRMNVDGTGNTVGAGFVPAGYDYVGMAYPNSTTEVFTFKSGGSGGTTLSTVTITYTDSTKTLMSSAERT